MITMLLSGGIRWWGLLFGAAFVVYLASMVRTNLRRPPYLGVRDGRLAACPTKPNGVSSQVADAHRIEALRYVSSPHQAMLDLQTAVREQARVTVITAEAEYLYVEARSAVFRFVDDVEFVLNPAHSQIECRSFARVGQFDFGVNRRRIEAIRRRFDALQRHGSYAMD